MMNIGRERPGICIDSRLEGATVFQDELTSEEIEEGHGLLQKKRLALQQNGDDHYWNNFNVVYGPNSSVKGGSMGWCIKCKNCGAKLGTSNISATVSRHMKSSLCKQSNKAWLKHKKITTDSMTPAQAEACDSIVQSSSKKSIQSTIDLRPNKAAIDKFANQLKRWIIYNSTSISFRALEDPALKDALKVLGYEHGINRKILATTFLDGMYDEFVLKRSQSISFFGQYQLSADSWKYKNANRGKKLVGATLNMPDGSCQLGDIFVTTDDDKVTSDYIYDRLSSLINILGADEYIGSIFDGEQAYQNAGRRLQEKFPWSIHLTCYAHTLNLLIKDISNTKYFKDSFSNAHKMVALCNVRECRAELNKIQLELYGQEYPIRSGVETRFAFMVQEVEDLLKSEDAIKSLTDNRSLRQKFSGRNTSTEDQREAFVAIDQYEFWDVLKRVKQFLSPLSQIIHFIEQDTSLVGQLFFITRYLNHKFRLKELEMHKVAMNVPAHATPRRLLFDFEVDMAEQVLKRISPAFTGARASNVVSRGIPILAFLLDLRFYTHAMTANGLRFIPSIKTEIAGITRDTIEHAKSALLSISPAQHKQSVLEEFNDLLLNGIGDVPEEISLSLIQVRLDIPQESEWEIQTNEENGGNYLVGALWRQLSLLPGCKFPLLARYVGPNLFSLHATSCSTERVWSRMRHLFRPLRNNLDPVKAKKILLISLARSFGQNMRKRKRDSGYSDEPDGGKDDSDLEDDNLRLPDDWLEGIDLNALDNNLFDLAQWGKEVGVPREDGEVEKSSNQSS